MNEVQRLLEARKTTELELEGYRSQLKTYDSELANLWAPYLEKRGFNRVHGRDLKKCSPAWEEDLEKNPVHIGERNGKRYLARSKLNPKEFSSFCLYERTKENLYKTIQEIDSSVTATHPGKTLLCAGGGSLLGAGIGALFHPLASAYLGLNGAVIGGLVPLGFDIFKLNYGSKQVFSERSPSLAMEKLEKILKEN